MCACANEGVSEDHKVLHFFLHLSGMLLFLFFSVVVVHGTVEDAERFEIEMKH